MEKHSRTFDAWKERLVQAPAILGVNGIYAKAHYLLSLWPAEAVENAMPVFEEYAQTHAAVRAIQRPNGRQEKKATAEQVGGATVIRFPVEKVSK